MPKIEITLRDKKQLVKMCKIYEDIFYVKERKNPPKDEQWTIDDLSALAGSSRQIVSILKKYFDKGKIKV